VDSVRRSIPNYGPLWVSRNVSAPAYLPLFGSDYLADTRHLSTEEHGAYLLLMIAAWRGDDCDLPMDDKKLARITCLSTRKWLVIKETILEFWTVENGRIRHTGRCTQPRERVTLSRFVTAEVRKRDGEKCRYCSTENGPFEFDHVVPWSRGGLDTVENLVVACFTCNRAKSDRTPSEMGWAI